MGRPVLAVLVSCARTYCSILASLINDSQLTPRGVRERAFHDKRLPSEHYRVTSTTPGSTKSLLLEMSKSRSDMSKVMLLVGRQLPSQLRPESQSKAIGVFA